MIPKQNACSYQNNKSTSLLVRISNVSVKKCFFFVLLLLNSHYYFFAGLSVPGVPAPVVGVQQAMSTPVSIPLPTQCIMLLNMFDPTK